MAQLVCSGATVVCTGSLSGTPVRFSVFAVNGVRAGEAPLATVQDRAPFLNVPSFGLCKMSTPPVPCAPALAPSFLTGAPTVLIAGIPALTAASKLTCLRGGVVSFQSPGQISTATS